MRIEKRGGKNFYVYTERENNAIWAAMSVAVALAEWPDAVKHSIDIKAMLEKEIARRGRRGGR